MESVATLVPSVLGKSIFEFRNGFGILSVWRQRRRKVWDMALNKNGRRSQVNASSVMVGDELIMAGEKNVFVENVHHYSTRYRDPSHVVIIFRRSTGEPVARTYNPTDRVSVIETPTTYKARRRNSWLNADLAKDGRAQASFIAREKGFPVRKTRNVTMNSRSLVVTN